MTILYIDETPKQLFLFKRTTVLIYLYGSPCCRKSFCSLALAFAFNSFTNTLAPPGSVYISLNRT